MQNLVIVESPTKARTLAKFLGKKYQIEASRGHVRDLPRGEFGVDVERDFEPKYIIPRDKKKRVGELKKAVQAAQHLWLATDPDREGEAIAWHLAYLLGEGEIKNEIKRVVFHEITEDAIKQAFEHPRSLDKQLIDAQQARRVLDRLVGYRLSPLLWRKVKKGLSAGRVQTVALRLIAEREREIERFKPIEYWTIEAELEPKEQGSRFLAALLEKNHKKVEIGSQKETEEITRDLEQASYKVSKVTEKEVKRLAPPPFTTSTLQQAAGNKLGMSAKKTMMVAQNLYEHGLITYMRTDSVNLSEAALKMTRDYISVRYDPQYLPKQPRLFTNKSKNAQEAHEAIRPTNIKLATERLKGEGFTRDHKRLYDLIWKRTLASQMAEAITDQTTVDVSAVSKINNYLLRAVGSILRFEGWLKLYGAAREDPQDGENSDKQDLSNQVLPKLTEEDKLNLMNLAPLQHFTEAPPRYSEASLVKKLEELGIGRPSTYASILTTIQERFYVEKNERRFMPTALGLAVNDFLIKYFPEVFDYNFTAQMEDQLDDVSRGERDWREILKAFYPHFDQKVNQTSEQAEKVKLELEVTDKICQECGKNLVVRTGRFGKFLACSGFPECKHTERLEEKTDIKCPEDGAELVIRKTKRGKTFYGCKNWPGCKFASWNKPKLAGAAP